MHAGWLASRNAVENPDHLGHHTNVLQNYDYKIKQAQTVLIYLSDRNSNKYTYKNLYFVPTWIIKVPVFMHAIYSVS